MSSESDEFSAEEDNQLNESDEELDELSDDSVPSQTPISSDVSTHTNIKEAGELLDELTVASHSTASRVSISIDDFAHNKVEEAGQLQEKPKHIHSAEEQFYIDAHELHIRQEQQDSEDIDKTPAAPEWSFTSTQEKIMGVRFHLDKIMKRIKEVQDLKYLDMAQFEHPSASLPGHSLPSHILPGQTTISQYATLTMTKRRQLNTAADILATGANKLRSSIAITGNSFNDLERLARFWKLESVGGMEGIGVTRLRTDVLQIDCNLPGLSRRGGLASLTRNPEGFMCLKMRTTSQSSQSSSAQESKSQKKQEKLDDKLPKASGPSEGAGDHMEQIVEKTGWREVAAGLLQEQNNSLHKSLYQLLRDQAEPPPGALRWQLQEGDGTSRVSENALHVSRPGLPALTLQLHAPDKQEEGCIFELHGLKNLTTRVCMVSLLSLHLSRTRLKTQQLTLQAREVLRERSKSGLDVHSYHWHAPSAQKRVNQKALLFLLVEHVSFRQLVRRIQHSLATIVKHHPTLNITCSAPIPPVSPPSLITEKPSPHVCSWTVRREEVFILEATLRGANLMVVAHPSPGCLSYDTIHRAVNSVEELEQMVWQLCSTS